MSDGRWQRHLYFARAGLTRSCFYMITAVAWTNLVKTWTGSREVTSLRVLAGIWWRILVLLRPALRIRQAKSLQQERVSLASNAAPVQPFRDRPALHFPTGISVAEDITLAECHTITGAVEVLKHVPSPPRLHRRTGKNSWTRPLQQATITPPRAPKNLPSIQATPRAHTSQFRVTWMSLWSRQWAGLQSPGTTPYYLWRVTNLGLSRLVAGTDRSTAPKNNHRRDIYGSRLYQVKNWFCQSSSNYLLIRIKTRLQHVTFLVSLRLYAYHYWIKALYKFHTI